MPAVGYQLNEHGRVVDDSAEHSDRVYAMVTHLTLLAGHVFIMVLPALAMWVIRRRDSAFLDDHGKEAVNFQLSLLLYWGVAIVLSFVWVGYILFVPIYILGLVGMVLGARAANRGEYFRYPMTLRFVR